MFHGLPDDIADLDPAAVIRALEYPEATELHASDLMIRLQTAGYLELSFVTHPRHGGTLKAGIVGAELTDKGRALLGRLTSPPPCSAAASSE